MVAKWISKLYGLGGLGLYPFQTLQKKCSGFKSYLRQLSSYHDDRLLGESWIQNESFSQVSDLQNNTKRIHQATQSGQPTSFTHPHILRNGELTGGIAREEYMNRQFRLMEMLARNTQESDQHVVILPGSPRRYMIDKIPYHFRQDTDMLYLSGCLETDCVLVMHTLPNSPGNHKALIFTPPYDPSKELWDGPRTPPSGASHVWGVNEGLPMPELPRYLSSIEKELCTPNIWYNYSTPPNSEIHHLIQNWVFLSRKGSLQSPKEHIHALRVIKSPAEIAVMRDTCSISAESIKATIRACKAPALEQHLFATVDYQCRMRGAEYLAYPPVVAGGKRANIIHYINNNNVVQPGELVLMDAGSEYRGYSGDVTRTWPVSGQFTPGQRDVYEAVLEVQKSVIAACVERPSLNKLFSIMCTKLGAALQELCILPKNMPQSQLSRAAYGFCPHHVSHYLGMDVHDTFLIPKSKDLSVGSILTVEPGVYISPKNTTVDSRYLGLGIRLEDDILITESDIEVLSNACPKHPDEIEALVGADYKM